MFRYVVIAAIVTVLSVSIVERIQQSEVMQSRAPVRAQAARPAPANAARSRVVISAKDGQFETNANVNGRPLTFMVDTGASLIALRESDAASIGIRTFPDQYKIRTSTANGEGVAAPAELDRVEIDGIEVRGVRAMILPDSALSVNLLGMSFLSRIRWTHETGRLVLEQ